MIAAVVLCGGRGERLGGTDKPLLEVGGRPLVARVLDRLVGQVGEVLISANRHLDEYRRFGYPVVSDRVANLGPVAGIAAAAAATRADLLFVCPGDSPCLPVDLVARLHARFMSPGGREPDAVVANDGGRDQPLFLLLRRSVARTAADYLNAGERSVHGWLAGLDVIRCVVRDGGAFTNVNTLEDLTRLDSHWQSDPG
ncbi:MAG: molybdenum cofactor guanylyltransferase MobA [Pseudomonadales bacterium]